jgi:hypothetical protein
MKSADFAVPHANAPERVAIGVKIATSSTRKSAGEHGGVPLTLWLGGEIEGVVGVPG